MRKSEPLLLISDLIKGMGNRDGLVQQVITYVRDGKTVVRKQWVRSEFAEHAKNNEKNRKKKLVQDENKEEKKHKTKLELAAERAAIEDRKNARRTKKQRDITTGADKESSTKEGRQEHKKIQMADKKKIRSEMDKIASDKKNRLANKKNNDVSDRKAKDKRGAYGQADTTRADTKREQTTARNTVTKESK